jgi:hypothetical protein
MIQAQADILKGPDSTAADAALRTEGHADIFEFDQQLAHYTASFG